jgi:hypothetical protein
LTLGFRLVYKGNAVGEWCFQNNHIRYETPHTSRR